MYSANKEMASTDESYLPTDWSEDRPREAPRAMAQEGMQWEIVLEDVIEILAELPSTDYGREWRVK